MPGKTHPALKLGVARDEMFECWSLVLRHSVRIFCVGAVPFAEPVMGEERMTAGQRISGRQRDGSFLFHAGTASAGDVEASGEQGGAHGGGGGVGKHFDRPVAADAEELAEGGHCPILALSPAGKHVIKNEIRQSGGDVHRILKSTVQQMPA